MVLVHVLLQHYQTSLETVIIEDSGRPRTCRRKGRRGRGGKREEEGRKKRKGGKGGEEGRKKRKGREEERGGEERKER